MKEIRIISFKRYVLGVLFVFSSLTMYSQTSSPDTIQFKLLFEKNEPMRGATLYVKGSNPPYGTTSDMNGQAKLILKESKSIIELSFMGPYIAFEINQPTDSVFVNLQKKKLVYYLKNKKIKKKKLKIDGY